MAIRKYYTRWLIRTNSYDLTGIGICKIFTKLYVFYEFLNSYEWPTPNPARKPIHHWGLDKSYKIVRVRSYKFVQISHLVKYVQIGHEIALYEHWNIQQQPPKTA